MSSRHSRDFTEIEMSIIVGEAALGHVCYSVCALCCDRAIDTGVDKVRDVIFEGGADPDLAAHEVSL